MTMTQAKPPAQGISPGHRVTLTRRHLIGRTTVITTNANPSHADALRDLRHQFKAVTGRAYLPRRGDILTHEVTV